jgi:uncharacterized Tic20 family protein
MDMSEFLLAGLLTTLFYLAPLILLPVAALPFYWLHTARRRKPVSPVAQELDRLNYQIARYLVYLLAVPSIMLVTSVLMAFSRGVHTVLDSLIWLIAAITVAFGWCIYRLVGFVSARTRLEQAMAEQAVESA